MEILKMGRLKCLLLIMSTICLSTAAFADELYVSANNFEESLNKILQTAKSKDTIVLPAGKFYLLNEVLIQNDGLTLKGQGPNKTILSFKKQKAGPQGILATANQLRLKDFAVEDTAGNGIKVVGTENIVFDKIKVSWSSGSKEENGSYGIYPVLTKNVLVQDCEVSGASDAGIYVGQSEKIIVRRNYVHGNVAGLEIENSSEADVYENTATKNTVGILVFNLPDLMIKDSRKIRIFNNLSSENNLKNFSTKGSIINLVPAGIGMLVLAAHDVEIFMNQIIKNKLTGVSINNYLVSGRKLSDPQYNPMPQAISIHDNFISKGSLSILDTNQITLITKLIFGLRSPAILYDGIMDGTYSGQPPAEKNKICIYNNNFENGEPADFGNLHLDNQRKGSPFPGGPGTKDLAPHNCRHAQLPPQSEIDYKPLPGENNEPSEAETLKACKSPTSSKNEINLAALNYNCPDLSDYNLFQNPIDPTKNPNGSASIVAPNNELFTDYAKKDRFIFLPKNSKMNYVPTEAFEFPIGAVIAKTFSIYLAKTKKLKKVETRLLIKRSSGWEPLNYVWNSTETTATLTYGGAVETIEIFKNERLKNKLKIDYHIPNLKQCASCHNTNHQIQPLGIKAKFLNWNFPSKENQLVQLKKYQLLDNLPTDLKQVQKIPRLFDDSEVDLENRVKAYLDINCAHCHNPKGNARNTGLYLSYEVDSKSRAYGVCKTPAAAGIGSGGRKYALQPGSAKDSVLFYRLNQSHLAVKMPQLGRSASHSEALQLIQKWIDSLAPVNCDGP